MYERKTDRVEKRNSPLSNNSWKIKYIIFNN